MNNLILFLNSFLSYLLLFLIMAGLVVLACVLGVKLRKYQDAKANAVAEPEKEEK